MNWPLTFTVSPVESQLVFEDPDRLGRAAVACFAEVFFTIRRAQTARDPLLGAAAGPMSSLAETWELPVLIPSSAVVALSKGRLGLRSTA
jgi:hypothetical protein